MSDRIRLKTRNQKRTNAKPPKFAERLLLSLLPESLRDNISGDLSEIFTGVIVPSYGIARARFWYWRQVVCSISLARRLRKNPQSALQSWKGQIQIYKPMHDVASYHPGISMHHISVGSNVAGLIFVIGTIFIFGVGIPALRVLLVISGILGILVAGIIRRWHKRHACIVHSLDLHKLE
jgi:hypothetical protein